MFEIYSTAQKQASQVTSATGSRFGAKNTILLVTFVSIFSAPDTGSIPMDLSCLKPLLYTTSGLKIPQWKDSASAISEVRLLSGLTWDQLAQIFKVDRRSLHFWASGKSLSGANEEKLSRVLSALKQIDQGSAKTNRQLLLSSNADGISPFFLLQEERFAEVITLANTGNNFRSTPAASLSSEAKNTRRPKPPSEMIDALHDKAHEQKGNLIKSGSIRPISEA